MQESSNVTTPAAPTAGPWGMVPIWVLDPDQYLAAVDPATLKEGDDKPLNGTDMRVYVALRSFADADGRCWPNTRTVAERANVGKSTAEKAIGKMRRVGLLTSELRHRPDGSISGCVYHLRNDPPCTSPADGAPSDPEGGTLESEGGVPQDSRGGTSESEGEVPANPTGGTGETEGAGTNQGTHQGTDHPALSPSVRPSRERDVDASLSQLSLAHQVLAAAGADPAEVDALIPVIERVSNVRTPAAWWRAVAAAGDGPAVLAAGRKALADPSGAARRPSGPGRFQPFRDEISDADYAAYAAGHHREREPAA